MQENNFEKNMGEIVEQQVESGIEGRDLNEIRSDAETALNDYEGKTSSSLEKAFQAGTMDQESLNAAITELREARTKTEQELEDRMAQFEKQRMTNSRQHSLSLSHAL